MSGNVWEWCWDMYGSYHGSSQTNPHGANSGTDHITRGGYWASNTSDCRVAYRGDCFNPITSAYSIGFRIVRAIP